MQYANESATRPSSAGMAGSPLAGNSPRTMNDDANEMRQMMESLVERMTSLACRVGVSQPEPTKASPERNIRDTLAGTQRETTGLLNEAFKQLSLLETIA